MSISPQILRHASALDPQQLDVVGHLEGPLLVRAGPGAGKTRVLVWRLVNLLLQDVCGPDEIVLLAFGTLAAAEMRQRVAAAARSVGYCGDVDRIKISTIHAMSHRILSAHHRRVGLKSGYSVLNREERQGFLNECQGRSKTVPPGWCLTAPAWTVGWAPRLDAVAGLGIG